MTNYPYVDAFNMHQFEKDIDQAIDTGLIDCWIDVQDWRLPIVYGSAWSWFPALPDEPFILTIDDDDIFF